MQYFILISRLYCTLNLICTLAPIRFKGYDPYLRVLRSIFTPQHQKFYTSTSTTTTKLELLDANSHFSPYLGAKGQPRTAILMVQGPRAKSQDLEQIFQRQTRSAWSKLLTNAMVLVTIVISTGFSLPVFLHREDCQHLTRQSRLQ